MIKTLNTYECVVINGNTKKAIELIERYERATACDLYDVYTSFSKYKYIAYQRCLDMCADLDGYGLRIIGANSCTFSVMFKFENGYIYITRDNDYFIEL